MDLSEVKNLPQVDHTPAHLDEASRLLLAAASYMELVGKCGVENVCGIDAAGRVCAFQALNHVPHEYETIMVARRRLAARFGGDERSVIHWSDRDTQESVVAAMRAAAFHG